MARPRVDPGAGGLTLDPIAPSSAPPPLMGLGAAAMPGFGPGGYDLLGAVNARPAGAVSLGGAVSPPTSAGARSSNPGPSSGAVRPTGGLGAAAMADVAPPPAPPSALQSALGEREGELDALYGILATPKQQVEVANKMRPIAEMEAQQFYGGGPLKIEPFTPPPIEAGEDEFAYMQRVQALQVEDEQRQIEAAGTLGDVRDIGASGHLGSAEASIQAKEGTGAAEIEQLERVAQVQKDAAEMSMQATADAQAADQQRRDFANQQREAIAVQQQVQQQARAKLQALPEMDHDRTFKSQSGGDLFWTLIGSLAGGAIGSTDVLDRLAARAQQDLEVQKANAAQTFDAANAADAAVGQQMGLYRDLLGAAGDEAAADAMFLQLQLEDAARLLEAEMSRTTVPVAKAQLQESLVGLKAQIDQQQQVIETRLATTPESFLRTVDPLGAGVRGKLEKRAERLEKERTDFQMKGVEGEGKYAEKAYDRETKMLEKGAERETKLAEKTVDKDFEIKKASDEWGAVETLVGDFLEANPDEIAGVGSPLGGDQADRIRTRAFKNALELMATSGFTGATASDRQAEQIKSLVEGEMWEMTDDAFRTRMGEIMNIASSRRRFYQDQLGSKAPRIGDPTKGGTSFQPE